MEKRKKRKKQVELRNKIEKQVKLRKKREKQEELKKKKQVEMRILPRQKDCTTWNHQYFVGRFTASRLHCEMEKCPTLVREHNLLPIYFKAIHGTPI